MKQFDVSIKQNLNSSQQKAVEPKDGVFIVIAGAGSNNTAEGIGLIQTQMSAEEIIRQVVAQAEALLNEGWKRHV